ncbi:hypothetical protein C2E23DRAFT_732313 [Lenzites betulinus]|nr:hypothetical protein C2E23DRAFT_732313 [Lenzites betulinus]
MHSRFSHSSSGSVIEDDADAYGERDVFSDDGGSLVDAPEGDSGHGQRRGGRPSGGSSQGGYSSSHAGYGPSSNGYGYSSGGGFRRGSAGAGGDEDDDDDDGRRRRPARLPLPVSSRAAAKSDTSEDESESESDYGESSPQPRRRERHDTTRPGAPATTSTAMSTSPIAIDDDVPLARQIPTALKAQRTIRRQVRDELDQKREERRAQRAQQALLSQQQQRPRVQSSAGDVPIPAPPPPPTGGSPPRPGARPRTKTLPSTISSPFSVGDLTKKLLGLQTTVPTAAPSAPQSAVSPMYPRSKRPSLEAHDQHPQPHGSASAGPSSRGRAVTTDPYAFPSSSRQASRPPPPEAARSLRPMRSFHRPRAGDADAYIAPPALPSTERTSAADQPLQRRATTASRRPPDEPPAFLASAPPSAVPVDQRTSSTLDRARSTRSGKSSTSRRPSLERRPEVDPPSMPTSRARSATTSAGASAAATPASTFSQPAKAAGQTMWQQRVFIGNMQRFCLVELGGGTCAGDVLNMVDAQGALEQGAGSGGWMLWEVSQDFGMERPIRNFEMLSEVCGAWNTDKTVNLLVIKKTLLAPLLSTKAMPSMSPVCSGYVQWEYKRGKWQKRWMELREHSIWLSKRDTGKDATFLCSLNNFDAYYVTRVHKSPKPYVFSIKSTDSLSFFENTADYVHVFSCGESEGKNWLEKILLARSYVLYQERNVLSNTAAAGPGATAGGLQRAGTRRQPGQRPAQTLVSVTAPKADPMNVPNSFEPAAGSLLARRH